MKRYGGYTDRVKGYADLETRFSSYNTKSEGLIGNGAADDRNALDTLANVTMQPGGGQLDVVGTPRIASNVTIPANVNVRYMAGASFVPDAGVTVTILGKVIDVAAGGAGSPEGSVSASPGRMFGQLDALVVSGLQWLKKKGADAFGWAPAVPQLLVPSLTTGTGSISAFGDSITAGQGAAPATASYVNVIAAALAGAVTSYAAGGTGVYTAIAQWYAVAAAAPRTSTATLILWMAGFNDLRRNGAAAKTLAKIKSCLRAHIALSFTNTSIAGSDGAVVKVGAWVNFAPAGGQTRSAALGGNAQAGTLGMTATWNFNGDSLVIGTFVSDGVAYQHGPATITVDGVLVQTYDPDLKTDNIADSAYDNGRVPDAIIIRGLGSGAHVVVIAPTHAARPFIVDYLSTLVAPGDATPMLVSVPPRMNAIGYGTAPANATDAVMATGAAAIMDVVNELPDYPIRSVWPNSQYDLATGVSADNIHPNNAGHGQIAKAFLYAIQTAITPLFRGAAAGSMKIGRAAVASAASTTALGDNAAASGLNAEATGTNSVASGARSNAHGSSASATGDRTVAIGTSAASAGADGTAVGDASIANSASATAFGSGAQATNTNATVAGKGATGNQDRATAFGAVAAASATGAMALGANSAAAHADATAIGRGSATTAANQVRGGRNTDYFSAPGGLAFSHTATKVANYNAALGDHVIIGDATGGAFNVTLPDATLAQHLDRTYVIKKIDASANAVTVACTGGQTIDGAATKVLGAQWAFVRVMSNGANWLIIG